jgi:glycosyltransferase involved in cell wall biosynthesis
MHGIGSNRSRWAMSDDEIVEDSSGPALSLIVAVEAETAATRRTIDEILATLDGAPVEVILASREAWVKPPAGVMVVVYDSAPRGERFDRAAEAARGELLAFTDDHVLIPKGWASRVIEVFEDPSVVIAGGPILPRTRSRGERVSAIILDRQIGLTPGGHMSRIRQPQPVAELAGSNLVVRREAFWEVGGFQSPTVGGESVRLCYKVRTLLGCDAMCHPELAVSANMKSFPRAFLGEMVAFGRARGDLARRLPDVVRLLPYALPVLLWILLIAEAAALATHHFRVALGGASILAVAFLVQAVSVILGKGRFSDRLLAIAGLPLVPLAYGLGFLRGFAGPSLGEVSPPRQRKRPLRVLILNWRDTTHPWAGGAETYIHELGTRWVADGLDVEWLCQRYKGSSRTDVIDGIRVQRVGGRFTLYPRVILRYCLRLRGRFDVVVDCENGIPFFTPLFARIPKILVVHHVHRDIFRRETKPPIRWLGFFLEGWVMPRAYRRAAIIAVSESTRDDLVSMGFARERISIIHNGVQALHQFTPQPSRSPRILCMGRLTRQKRVDVALRAMSSLLREFPDARLDIVGQGPDRARLERLSWSLNLAYHVRFHGYLPGPARDELAARAWVAVCPSAFEGWGVTAMESSARGLPVVASNVNGLRDSVRDGETGVLVPVDEPKSLGRALSMLVGDREMRARMGNAGIEWAASHSWDRSADEMRTLLASLAGREEPQSMDLSGRAATPDAVWEDLVAADAH